MPLANHLLVDLLYVVAVAVAVAVAVVRMMMMMMKMMMIVSIAPCSFVADRSNKSLVHLPDPRHIAAPLSSRRSSSFGPFAMCLVALLSLLSLL